MEMSHLALISALFLSLLTRVHPSNPDSVIVQDISDSNDTEVIIQKSLPIRSAKIQSRSPPYDSGDYIPGISIVRVIRPSASGTHVILREIRIPTGLTRMGDRNILYNAWRGPGNRRQGAGNSNNGRGQASATGNIFPNSGRGENANRPGVAQVGNERYIPPINVGGASDNGWGVRNDSSSFGGQNPKAGLNGQNTRVDSIPSTAYRAVLPPSTNVGNEVPENTRGGPSQSTNFDNRVPENTRGGPSQSTNFDNRVPENTRGGPSLSTNFDNRAPSNTRGGQPSSTNYGNRVPVKTGGNPPPSTNYGNGVPPNTRGGAAPSANSGNGGRIPPNGPRGPPVSTPNRKVHPDADLFAGMVNDFAFRVIESMNLNSNFVVSPMSIFLALSMLYLASEGQTRTQMERVLGLDENSVHGDRLHQGLGDLLSVIASSSSEYKGFWAAVNGMFLDQNFVAEPKFLEDLQRYYAAELKNVDFGNPEQSTKAINDWVSENTRNAITNLLDRPPSPMTRLILLNVVYFKGIWKTQFSQNLTYNGKFNSPGGVREVPTMVMHEETFPLYRSDEQRHTFIKLPYSGGDVSMVIALPYDQTERPMPLARGQSMCRVLDSMRNTRLRTLSLPRFKLNDVKSLRKPLQQMGISDIFNTRTADLGRLRRQKDVYVSAIIHNAVLEVNEAGTTAAAVTGARIVPLMLRNITDFLVDRPFAFYIVHEPSGLVMFYGKVYDIGRNPAGASANYRREMAKPRLNSDAAVENVTAGSGNPSGV